MTPLTAGLAACLLALGPGLMATPPIAQAGAASSTRAFDATQRAIPRVPVVTNHAKSISPAACSGRNWVFITLKADVPGRQFRAVIRTKIDRSWIFSFEKASQDKTMRLFIKGSCNTIYKMLDAGASRARVTAIVTAPGYRGTKVVVEIPIKY